MFSQICVKLVDLWSSSIFIAYIQLFTISFTVFYCNLLFILNSLRRAWAVRESSLVGGGFAAPVCAGGGAAAVAEAAAEVRGVDQAKDQQIRMAPRTFMRRCCDACHAVLFPVNTYLRQFLLYHY